jgi:hypothetical protein
MRFLMDVDLPVGKFNESVRDGSIGEKIQKILEDMKPEAAYFSERDGQRGGLFVINVENPSDIPSFAEPWFLNFDASVKFRVAMTPEDLGAAGLDDLAKKWG